MMTQSEMLYEFKQMSIHQQLEMLRSALEIIEERISPLQNTDDSKLPLREAAQLMLEDYTSDPELTAFTSLDGEEFNEAW